MSLSLLRVVRAATSRSFQRGFQPSGIVCLDQVNGSCSLSCGINSGYRLWQDSQRVELRLYSSKSAKHEATESDSDSDDDTKKERGITEFWRRKMRTFHGILDINKDGVISFDDLQMLVDRFVDLGHLSPQHQKEFYSLIKTMWEERWGSLDQYNMITTEILLEEMHHVLNDKNLRKKVHNFLPYLFKALDKDKSGLISVEEYKLFFTCLGLSNEAAVVSFSVIDENNDGKLSMQEFVKLGRDFFTSEDQKRPSKMFWGPLLTQ